MLSREDDSPKKVLVIGTMFVETIVNDMVTNENTVVVVVLPAIPTDNDRKTNERAISR